MGTSSRCWEYKLEWSFWKQLSGGYQPKVNLMCDPLDCKEIKPINCKGNQFWTFIGRTDAETPILWPSDAKNSLEKTLIPEKIEGRRRRGWQRMRWLGGITNSMDMSLSKLGSWWGTGKPGMLQSMGSQRVGHDWVTELNWGYKVKEIFILTPLHL